MVGLIRWILGYVKFVAKGVFPERFMNLIAKSNICIWDISKKKDELFASVVASEYKDLKKISRKTGTNLKVIKKCGLPFYIHKYKRRKGIIIGAIIFCIFLYIFSIYIWEIELTGDVPENTSEIEEVIADVGLSKGCIKNGLDIPYLEQSIMMKVPSLSWVSINIKGSLAEVSLKQRQIPPTIIPKSQPCNIKSSTDAQVVRMEVYNGTPVVNDGDAVVKGQILVSGIFEDKWGGNAFKHADAKIWALTKKSMSDEISLNQEKHIPTDKVVKRKKMKVFGLEIPLSLVPVPKWNYSKELSRKDLYILGRRIPITICKEIYTEEIIESVIIDEDEAKVQAERLVKTYEENNLKDIKILKKDVNQFIEDDKYIINVEYECQENIAYKEEIIVE